MDLIEKFENMSEQTVKAFNEVFKSTPILNVDENLPVEIREPAAGDERKIKIGDEIITLCLIQKRYPRKVIPRTYKVVAFRKKECRKCKIVKPFKDFSPHKTSKGGVRSDCKKCCVKAVTDWKKRNAVRIKEEMKNKSEIKKWTRSEK